MRAYEFLIEAKHSFKGVSLRTINGWKLAQKARLEDEEKRKPLLASMYGHPINHDDLMQTIELEQEKVELAKKRTELENLKSEQGKDSYKAMQRLSRSAMRQRKTV